MALGYMVACMKIGRLLPLLAAVVVAAALAVPSITVTVQQLGVGVAKVVTPVNKAAVNFVFKIDHNGIVLDGVKLIFDKDLQAGSYIRVELRAADGSVLTAGEINLQNAVTAGTPIFINLKPDLGVLEMMQIDSVVVVVAGPTVTS